MGIFDTTEISFDEVSRTSKIELYTKWPTVKSGLEILIEVVKNPFVKTAIGTVITLGDSLCSN